MMEKEKDLSRLESVVEKILLNLSDLKQENSDLSAKIREKDQAIAELEDTINSMSSDRENISLRVSSLISSIEDWEKLADKEIGSGDQDNFNDSREKDQVQDGSEQMQATDLFSIHED